MGIVMKHETWMRFTDVTFKPRSKYLKAVDRALFEYEQCRTEPNLNKLRLAMHHWKMNKGYEGHGGKPAWARSDRNRQGAVETLDRQLYGEEITRNESVLADLAELPFYGVEAWASDGNAKQALKSARIEALQELFAGKELGFKKTGALKAISGVREQLGKAKDNGGKLASVAVDAATKKAAEAVNPMLEAPRQAAEKLLQAILSEFQYVDLTDILKILAIPDLVEQIAASMAPYLSLMRSSAKLVTTSVAAGKAHYRSSNMEGHIKAVAAGDPQAAAQAIHRILKRIHKQQSALAAVYSVDVAVKATAVAGDFVALGTATAIASPLSGLASALATLSLHLYALCVEITEMKAANRILKDPTRIKLSAELFQECPLLGCYFIACSNTSNVVNFLVEDMGSTGWKLDVESLVKGHVAPLVEYARELIASGHFEVKGLEQSKGAVVDTSHGAFGVSNGFERFKKKVIAKVRTAVPFVEDPRSYQTVAAKQGYQAVSPELLRSRIQGHGNYGVRR